MDKNKVNAIKEWAMENYATSYGASCLIECYTDEELDASFSSLRVAQSFAELRDEQFSNAQF